MGDAKLAGLAAALLGAAHSAWAQPPVPTRTEVSVREISLSDGVRRYGVPIRVGSTEILAGLDTGSTGLRILPNILKADDARPTTRTDTYSYEAGAKFDGVVGSAAVSVGALSGDTTVQLIRRVGCREEKPRCAAGSLPISQYGVQGDGLPGEGFKAILGVNMATADAASLFKGIGAQRWIVDLPRPGENHLGRIVLNPTDDEVQGYVSLPIMDQFADRPGGTHDAIPGCLMNDATQAKFCGAVLLDTGAPGIEVVAFDISGRPWPNETPVSLLFADASGHVRVAEKLVIGRREHASRLSFRQHERMPTPVIESGLTPYFAYSILYDPAHGTVGFKPRAAMAGGPLPIAVN